MRIGGLQFCKPSMSLVRSRRRSTREKETHAPSVWSLGFFRKSARKTRLPRPPRHAVVGRRLSIVCEPKAERRTTEVREAVEDLMNQHISSRPSPRMCSPEILRREVWKLRILATRIPVCRRHVLTPGRGLPRCYCIAGLCTCALPFNGASEAPQSLAKISGIGHPCVRDPYLWKQPAGR